MYSVAVDPEGRVVSGSRDRTIKVWDIEMGRYLDIFGNESDISCMALSQEHRHLVCGDSQGHVWIFEWVR